MLVDGRIFVNDEPYWRNLLKPNHVYRAVYGKGPVIGCDFLELRARRRREIFAHECVVSRPPDEVPLSLKLLDLVFRTPTVHMSQVPSHSDEYTSTAARERLRSSGVLPLEETHKPRGHVRFCAQTEWNPAVKGMYMRLAGVAKEKAT